MAFNVDNVWLANVLAQTQKTLQTANQGVLSLSNKGEQCLIVNSYEYRKGRVINSGTVQKWRCINRACYGIAKTSFGSLENLLLLNPHVCRQSPNAFVRRDVIARIKSAAIANFGSYSTGIVASGKNGLTDNQLLSLPTNKALQDRVLRKKKPVGASSVDKPASEIKWLEYFTQTENGDRFLLHDSRETESRLPPIFIFLSPSGLRLLRENNRWALDGTFFCAPKNFVQLYTVNVFTGETTFPCVYALLPDKSTATYVRMFQVLKNLHLQPQSVMIDFESAAINALDEVFEDFAASFCLFHLSKNAFANVQSKHLRAAYDDIDARELLRCLPSLAFLPEKDVATCFDEIKEALQITPVFQELNLEGNLLDYLHYFEKTYIRRRVRGIPADGLFLIKLWNCNAASINGLPRTNNHVEGWHKDLNERFQKSHMNLSQFIVRLKAEEEKTRQLVVRARVNPAEALRQPRRPEYEMREANIRLLVCGYQSGRRMDFLKAVQHHLVKFPFVRQEEDGSDEEVEGNL